LAAGIQRGLVALWVELSWLSNNDTADFILYTRRGVLIDNRDEPSKRRGFYLRTVKRGSAYWPLEHSIYQPIGYLPKLYERQPSDGPHYQSEGRG